MGLKHKPVSLVVGGTGDIGKAICQRLLDSDSVVVVSGQTQERADTAVKALGGASDVLASCVINITDPDSCKQSVIEIEKNFGHLDNLVNCAGISYIAPVLLGKIDAWRNVLEVNSLGAFIISQAAMRPMVRQRYGRIIHIGSISAEVGAPYNAIYAASKAAIAGLVRSLALEIAASGITVNAVQPGYVKTKLFAQTQGVRAKIKGVTLDEHENDLIRDTPTRVLVTPDDVASLVNYLASNESRSITGQMLNVDGGRTAG